MIKKDEKKVSKKEMKKVVKKEDNEVDKKNILGAMPKLPPDGTNPKPVRYNGGVIYTSNQMKSFRALLVRGDKYSEKAARWGDTKPSSEAWKLSIKRIDTARKAKN